MKIGKILLILALCVVGSVVIVGGCVYSGHNKAVSLDEGVHSAWAQVENQLQRRFDLIPNVIATVKGLAEQEKDIFLGVAEARKSYFQAKSTGEKAQAAGSFGSALSRLMMLKETYPDLKSNQAFLKLQDTVEGTENRLGVERGRYNNAVKQLNTFARGLTGRFYASLAGVEKAEYFEVSEEAKAVPKVDFSSD